MIILKRLQWYLWDVSVFKKMKKCSKFSYWLFKNCMKKLKNHLEAMMNICRERICGKKLHLFLFFYWDKTPQKAIWWGWQTSVKTDSKSCTLWKFDPLKEVYFQLYHLKLLRTLWFFKVLNFFLTNGPCTLFGQTNHCGPPPIFEAHCCSPPVRRDPCCRVVDSPTPTPIRKRKSESPIASTTEKNRTELGKCIATISVCRRAPTGPASFRKCRVR